MGILTWGACGDGPPEGDGVAPERPACNPLDEGQCVLPWPSMYSLNEDDSAETGWRVTLAPSQLPINDDGVEMDPFAWNEKDGFSINSALIVHAPRVALSHVPTAFGIERYTEADIDVVVVDVQTGERHPIWVEVDETAFAFDGTFKPDEQMTFIRPAVPWDFNRRYVVGIRNLRDADGEPVAFAGQFAAIRDGSAEEGSWLAAETARYEEEVFPALEGAGVARDELQLAWDFHTMSRASTLGPIEAARDRALDWAAEQGSWSYSLDEQATGPRVRGIRNFDCEEPGEHIAREVEGWFEAPLFTEGDEPENPNTEEREGWLTRDDQGLPFVNGTRRVPFVMRIPCSVALDPPEGGAPLMLYGHGLLGGYGEARTGYLQEMADRYGFILMAQNWTGFASEDYVAIVSNLIRAPGNFAAITERSAQGLVEKVLGPRFAQEALRDDPDATHFDGATVLSATELVYYGNSQGGIMGSALMGLSPDLERGVLGVNGGPYSLLLPRSVDFDPFFDILRQYYVDHRELMMFVVGLTQQVWDPVEPGGWMWDLGRDSGKHVLMQVGIYDNQVTTLGSQIQARAYDAFIPSPSVREVWGVRVEDATDGVVGSGYVEWLYPDLPPEFEEAFPPGRDEDLVGTEFEGCRQTDPHEAVRRERASQDQLWHFLTTGEVLQTCDPTVGCVSDVKLCFPD